ncbi:nuclear transport factor 2 family protein [Pseudonocardia acaciae]|uniref:nuclear transport factor 2 family protein n=1 Tax=Pseudonocardia acaciae TaxID=551276 RepID=UPI00048C6D88|nr:nuclear transport factor 2 family protein [Pseudonocardia acaciae]
MSRDLTEAYFKAVDSRDAAAVAGFFAADGRMTFGNNEPLVGPAAVEQVIAGVFAAVAGIEHRILRDWYPGDDTLTEADVTFTKHDGSQVTVPAAVHWHATPNGKIDDMRVYIDLAPVFAP